MVMDEFELPISVSADQVRRREFVAAKRGYEPEQVRAFLEQVAARMDELEQRAREAELRAEKAATAPPPRDDPYEQVSRRIAEAMRTADEAASRITAEARLEAETMLDEARTESDRIRVEAKQAAESALSSAEETIRDARERAERALGILNGRRDVVLEFLGEFRDRLLTAAGELEEAIMRRGEMPDHSAEPVEPVPQITAQPVESPDLDATTLDPAYGDLFETESTASIEDRPIDAAPPSDDLDLDLPDIPRLDVSWDELEGGSETTSR